MVAAKYFAGNTPVYVSLIGLVFLVVAVVGYMSAIERLLGVHQLPVVVASQMARSDVLETLYKFKESVIVGTGAVASQLSP